MSLLTVINRVCAQASLPTFEAFIAATAVTSNTGRTATELLTHALEAGEEIARRAEWSNLYEEFIVPSGNASETLPSDFHRLIQGNAVQLNTTFEPVLPVKSRDAWTVIQNTTSSQPYYFLDRGSIYFAPTLTRNAVVRYISDAWITTSGGDASEFSGDDDTVKFSEPLLSLGILWRYKRAKALEYADIQAEFEAELAREIAADRGI